jgi:putative spermidine/putrescine transport system ATP-binding protein
METHVATEAGEYLRIEHVAKRYGAKAAVADVSFTAKRGELITLLGPSGCGKTTMLNMIAGFLTPDVGDIYVDGVAVTTVPPHRRATTMVFQNYALFPHMTVGRNVEFGLRMRGLGRTERAERATEALDLVRLPSDTHSRFPSELSGGQQQRVALARALVVRPKLLLLDEPLSNLDAKLRKQLRAELREIHDRAGTTTVFVTHDLDEAFEVSDRTAVMNAGLVEQLGTPGELYNQPLSEFVADFVGHRNLLRGAVHHDVFEAEGSGFSVPAKDVTDAAAVTAVVVPEGRIRVSTGDLSLDHTFRGRVRHSTYRGRIAELTLTEQRSGVDFVTETSDAQLLTLAVGTEVQIGWDYGDLIWIRGREAR